MILYWKRTLSKKIFNSINRNCYSAYSFSFLFMLLFKFKIKNSLKFVFNSVQQRQVGPSPPWPNVDNWQLMFLQLKICRTSVYTTIHTVLAIPLPLIDPSPKAWEALLVGTIPVLEHSALDDAYSQLPVWNIFLVYSFYILIKRTCRPSLVRACVMNTPKLSIVQFYSIFRWLL